MTDTLLIDSLPDLAQELTILFQQKGVVDLVPQLSTLPIVDRCRCGSDFCATLYTAVKPDREYGIPDTVPLDPDKGFLILDLRDRRIVTIEVLYRPEIREKVLRLLP